MAFHLCMVDFPTSPQQPTWLRVRQAAHENGGTTTTVIEQQQEEDMTNVDVDIIIPHLGTGYQTRGVARRNDVLVQLDSFLKDSTSANKNGFVLEMTSKNEEEMELIVKRFKAEEGMRKFVSFSLTPLPDTQKTLVDLLIDAFRARADEADALREANNRKNELSMDLDRVNKLLSSKVLDKNNIVTNMSKKFILVLNEKKAKIMALQQQLDDMTQKTTTAMRPPPLPAVTKSRKAATATVTATTTSSSSSSSAVIAQTQDVPPPMQSPPRPPPRQSKRRRKNQALSDEDDDDEEEEQEDDDEDSPPPPPIAAKRRRAPPPARQAKKKIILSQELDSSETTSTQQSITNDLPPDTSPEAHLPLLPGWEPIASSKDPNKLCWINRSMNPVKKVSVRPTDTTAAIHPPPTMVVASSTQQQKASQSTLASTQQPTKPSAPTTITLDDLF